MRRRESGEPYLDMSIIKACGTGIWKVRYIYRPSPPYNTTEEDFVVGTYRETRESIGIAEQYDPERAFLLNFIFSPRPASPEELLRSGTLTKSQMRFIFPLGTERSGKFEVHKFRLDVTGMIGMYEKKNARERGRNPDSVHEPYDLEIHGLRERKTDEITIVRLGKVKVGSQTFHVYSGSELPLVREAVKQPKGSASPVRQRGVLAPQPA